MDRGQLRIADLKRRSPAARQLGSSQTEVVVALLDAGLDQAGKLRGKNGRRGK